MVSNSKNDEMVNIFEARVGWSGIGLMLLEVILEGGDERNFIAVEMGLVACYYIKSCYYLHGELRVKTLRKDTVDEFVLKPTTSPSKVRSLSCSHETHSLKSCWFGAYNGPRSVLCEV